MKLLIKRITIFYFLFSIFCFSSAIAKEMWIDGTPIIKKDLKQRMPSINEKYKVDKTQSISATQDTIPKHRVGSNINFWTDNIYTGGQELISATCLAVGKYCYIFVEDGKWDTTGTDTSLINFKKVNKFRKAFEESTPKNSKKGIYQITTETFGDIPDELDDDSRIYILLLDIHDGYRGLPNEPYIAGYFHPWNQLPNMEWGVYNYGWYSNEKELIYLDIYPSTIDVAIEVTSHEFTHMIQSRQDPDDEIWVDEGLADLSMFLCGYIPDDHIDSFLDHSSISLTTFNNELSEYGGVFLFMLYLYEHYGGAKMIKNLTSNRNTGIDGINQTLSQQGYSTNFTEIFRNWVVANYLDLSDTTIANGLYSYKSLNLNRYDRLYIIQDSTGQIFAYNYDDPRPGLDPTIIHKDYPYTGENIKLSEWSAKYIQFIPGDWDKLPLNFLGEHNSKSLEAKLIVEETNKRPIVKNLKLDKSNYFSGVFSDFERGYILTDSGYVYNASTITLLVFSTNNSSNYSYSALGDIETDVLEIFPNPATEGMIVNFRYTLTIDTPVKLQLFTLSGELVRDLVDGTQSAGYHQVQWNGKNEHSKNVASGIYTYLFRYKTIQIGLLGGYEIITKTQIGKIAIVK